ncbi:hypothetical protein BC830DRAFT_1158500 [Chytriomyces sp. MP71]|nr:hypothetical protein BC830DRAFT_1158500 [Chytriomyces sp. MP71]
MLLPFLSHPSLTTTTTTATATTATPPLRSHHSPPLKQSTRNLPWLTTDPLLRPPTTSPRTPRPTHPPTHPLSSMHQPGPTPLHQPLSRPPTPRAPPASSPTSTNSNPLWPHPCVTTSPKRTLSSSTHFPLRRPPSSPPRVRTRHRVVLTRSKRKRTKRPHLIRMKPCCGLLGKLRHGCSL